MSAKPRTDADRPTWRIGGVDQDTMDTIKAMIRYVPDDAKIARHVQVPVEIVEEYRKRQTCTRESQYKELPSDGRAWGIDEEPWIRKARESSAAMTKAMRRFVNLD